MDEFYVDVLKSLLKKGVLDQSMSILVMCAGQTDKESFLAAGFKNVTHANVDTRMKGDEFAPYQWSFQDAENIGFPDRSFDFCVEHSGLHHCHSPHRALLEMYRVARKGVLIFEPYDNLVTRVGIKLGLGQDYEVAAVYYNGMKFGGVKNTPIPNYAYRFTEQEIIKAVDCFEPRARHKCDFIYKLRIPWFQLKGRKSPLFFYAACFAYPFLKVLTALFPKQSNNFAAVVHKPEYPRNLQPWLAMENGEVQLNRSWLEKRYKG